MITFLDYDTWRNPKRASEDMKLLLKKIMHGKKQSFPSAIWPSYYDQICEFFCNYAMKAKYVNVCLHRFNLPFIA